MRRQVGGAILELSVRPLIVAASLTLCMQTSSAQPGSADFCVHLRHDHSSRVRTVADELLIGELRKRADRHLGADVSISANLNRWQVVTAPDVCPMPSTVVQLLVVTRSAEEVNACNLALGNDPDSFLICTEPRSRGSAAPKLQIHARSDRGLMLGAGRLLRSLGVGPFGVISIPHNLAVAVEPPAFGRTRGHQLTDWGFYMTTEFFEQYVKDLLVFGTNQIEFAHINYARGDQFKLVAWSKILDKYDLRVSMFNVPYSTDDDKAITRAVFANMTRIDSLFREGGGAEILPDIQELVTELHKRHPNATTWLSPCGLDEIALDRWLVAINTPATRSWLSGAAYGPGVHISQKQLVERLPTGYELRQYPDISHSLAAMYPQPNWDRPWAFTHGRLVVNPSPRRFAAIAKMNQNATYSRKAIGFGAYSEGASDDLNKALWSVIYMEPSTTADEVVGQYARHFLGDNETAGAALLSGLERNWDGNALSNTHVATTLATAQQLDRESSKHQPNWRLQAHTFRAFYDSYVQARAQWENKAEQAIMNAVADATLKTDASPAEALKLLKQRWIPGSNVTAWKARAFELAAALNHSLGGGTPWGGMAVLQSQDPTLGLLTIDTPTSNIAWLNGTLQNISVLKTVGARKRALDEIKQYRDPGDGGFYDNLGAIPRSPRLSSGFGSSADPQFLYAPLVSYDEGGAEKAPILATTERVDWYAYAQAYWNATVTLDYSGLDPEQSYRVRVVYNKYRGDANRTMTATGTDGKPLLVHQSLNVTQTGPYEFDVPRAATRGGSVSLSCYGPQGSGGMGRCCQISEVWLMKTRR